MHMLVSTSKKCGKNSGPKQLQLNKYNVLGISEHHTNATAIKILSFSLAKAYRILNEGV